MRTNVHTKQICNKFVTPGAASIPPSPCRRLPAPPRPHQLPVALRGCRRTVAVSPTGSDREDRTGSGGGGGGVHAWVRPRYACSVSVRSHVRARSIHLSRSPARARALSLSLSLARALSLSLSRALSLALPPSRCSPSPRKMEANTEICKRCQGPVHCGCRVFGACTPPTTGVTPVSSANRATVASSGGHAVPALATERSKGEIYMRDRC